MYTNSTGTVDPDEAHRSFSGALTAFVAEARRDLADGAEPSRLVEMWSLLLIRASDTELDPVGKLASLLATAVVREAQAR